PVAGAPALDSAVYGTGVPILGICDGAQLVARQLGGEVARTGRGEYGRTALEVTATAPSKLFGDLPPKQDVWMSHADSIVVAPAGFQVTARTDEVPVAALEDPGRAIYGVKFNPEVAHTPRGQEILKHFLFDVCGCRPTWTMTSIIEQSIDTVRSQVGDARVICGLSGGVDSAVAAALVHKAVGSQLTCVFVDTGLLREGEAEQVVDTFHRHQGIELIHARAEEIVWRQRFPGPGLAVRIIGEVTPERLAILRRADAVVREEIHRAGLQREIWQAFAVLPDVRSVGVMGDERTYAYPIVVRAVTSEDAMTADWARLPYDVLERLSSRIINEVPDVNRV